LSQLWQGHWKEDCKRPKCGRKEEAHHVKVAEAEQLSLLLATPNAMNVETVLRGVSPTEI
jgi:hypothetical protein